MKKKTVYITVISILLVILLVALFFNLKKDTNIIETNSPKEELSLEKNSFVCVKSETKDVEVDDLIIGDDEVNEELGTVTIKDELILDFNDKSMHMEHISTYTFTTKISYDKYFLPIGKDDDESYSHYENENTLEKVLKFVNDEVKISEDFKLDASTKKIFIDEYENMSYKCYSK